jgi:hypothetical protein
VRRDIRHRFLGVKGECISEVEARRVEVRERNGFEGFFFFRFLPF